MNCRRCRCWRRWGCCLLLRAPRETLLAFRAGGAGGRRRVLRHELPRPRQPAAALRPPQRDRSRRQLVRVHVHRQWRRAQSYWLDRQGIDRGEPTKLLYAVHVLVGHHGIFSLTPVWLLSMWGRRHVAASRATQSRRDLAAMVAALTLVCLVFYIGLRPQEDRNYGGMTSGFRWMFWFAPLWLVVMLPAADRLARSTAGMACRRGAAHVVRALGQLSDVESVDASVDLQLARVVRLARILERF